jgi:NAD(P)H dehydrogenase (quinone)
MILVTGAAGHLGQAVINHLLSTYNIAPGQIIATTRDPSKLKTLTDKGVNVRAASFDDKDSLSKAFAGAKRLLLISTDGLAPGQRMAQHLNAVAAAKAAGVEHVAYTSMLSPETSVVTFAPDHAGTEKAIADAGFKGWSILRNNWYFENLFMSYPQALKSGTAYSAAGKGKLAHIARDDLARAAAAVLASTNNGKNTYTLSGVKGYTADEIAAAVSKATGKPLNVVHVPLEGLTQGMISAGLPEGMARMVASFDDNQARGGFETITDDYKTLTGQNPQSFEDWMAKNGAALAA